MELLFGCDFPDWLLAGLLVSWAGSGFVGFG